VFVVLEFLGGLYLIDCFGYVTTQRAVQMQKRAQLKHRKRGLQQKAALAGTATKCPMTASGKPS